MGQYSIDIFEHRNGDEEPILRHRDNIEASDDGAAFAKATALYNEVTTASAKSNNTFVLALYEGERLVHYQVGPK